ncbi:hypothetical protein [[Clostridium] innocuum]|uniref:hypothetical protein n=1 Tax=Clostridium innocuum TaxID=1522 RepID=UPI001F40DCE9|nr:hypothetical protein [[Clostridium] innocuum]
MKPITGMYAPSSKGCRVRSGSCRAALKILPVHKLIGCLYTGSFARLRNTLYSPKKMVL